MKQKMLTSFPQSLTLTLTHTYKWSKDLIAQLTMMEIF